MIHAEVVVKVWRVGFEAAGRNFEVHGFRLGPFAGSFPFQKQAAILAMEDLAELGLASLPARLASNERPVGIFEAVSHIHHGRAIPQS